MRVRCLTTRCPDGRVARVTPGEIYEVIGIEANAYRIIDDRNDPVLFDPELFEVVDGVRPDDWVEAWYDGEEYAYPAPFNEPGFWEDYHEHEPMARLAFSRFLNRRLRSSGAA